MNIQNKAQGFTEANRYHGSKLAFTALNGISGNSQ